MPAPKDPIKNKEWREKKSQAMKGNGNPFYGLKHSEITKQKIRE